MRRANPAAPQCGGSPARWLTSAGSAVGISGCSPVRWLLLSQPLDVGGLGLLGSDRVSVLAPPAVGVVGDLFRRQPGLKIVFRALAHPVRVGTRPGP